MTGYVMKADHAEEYLLVIRSEDALVVQDFINNLKENDTPGINKLGDELEASWRRIWDE
jgi:hypothetical protein